MLELSSKWAPTLIGQPETGMGYQIATIELLDGTQYEQVLIIGGVISRIKGFSEIPFREDQIARIVVTHDKNGHKSET